MPKRSAQNLVQKVIDQLQRQPGQLESLPIPLAPDILEKLTVADGKPLPPSLRLWLSFDAQNIGLFSDLDQPIPLATSITEWGGYSFGTLQRRLLPQKSYQLWPSGGDSMWFLYAGQADEDGEYPIFVADVDDRYYVELFAPNFGVWLAYRYKIDNFNLYSYRNSPQGYASLLEHPDFGPSMRQHSLLNFHGYRYCEIYGEAFAVDGQPSRWCSDDELIADLKAQGFDEATVNALLGKDYDQL